MTVGEMNVPEGGRVKLKTFNGVDIYVTSSGRFEAKYTRGDGEDTFSRGALDDLEADIVRSTLGCRGAVKIGHRPNNPVSTYDISRATERVNDDGTSRYRIITGVQRQERDRRTGKGGQISFRTSSGDTMNLDGDYVRPAGRQDADWLKLMTEWRDILLSFNNRFEALREEYEPITAKEVLAALESQAAVTRRAKA